MSLNDFTSRLALQDAVLVQVQSTQGSAPRAAGAWMGVFFDVVVGTIGGGQLEFQAIDEARRRLGGAATDNAGDEVQRYPLGPSLGQCCGGIVHLRYERVSAASVPELRSRLATRHAPVALFGGGHVGRALVNVLGTLPFVVTWIDSRDSIFPTVLPPNVACDHSEPVQGAVAGLVGGSRVLIMSFSHAEDLDVVAACLMRRREQNDLPYIGLIGSKSKWAAFRHRLEQRGFSAGELEQVSCPIGLPGIAGKEPEVIAVSVAAQLLRQLSDHKG